MEWIQHHYFALGVTLAVLILGPLVTAIGQKWIGVRVRNPRAYYRDRKLLTTIVTIFATITVLLVWGRLVPHHGTFFGLLGAGLAGALREPLLSIAGRVAISPAEFTMREIESRSAPAPATSSTSASFIPA